MKPQGPTITISIPTFNRRDIIGKTLDSIFSQTEKPDEIIVVDDCSSDGTWEYLKKIKEVKVYRNKHNLGMIKNWNQSIKLATKDYIVSLHSDDLLLPNYIKTWKKIISRANNDTIGAYISAGYNINDKGKIIGIRQPFSEDILFAQPNTLKELWDNFIFYISVTGWTIYKRSMFDQIGYFTNKYGIAAENEMTMKIVEKYSVYYCATPLFAFRRHEYQGFTGKVRKYNMEQEIENLENGYKVLWDYENKKFVKSAFPNEEKTRIFIRKPIAFLIIYSLYCLSKFEIKKGLLYCRIFLKYYPRPFVDIITIELIIHWAKLMFLQLSANKRINISKSL